MDIINTYINKILDQKLEEAKKTSRSKTTRQTKIKRATGSMATSMARKKNDSIYRNMIKYRDLYYKYRLMVHKKYSARVRSKALR